MTEQNPPIFMDSTISPAEDARRFIAARNPAGVVTSTDLKVVQHAGTPNMSVDVAAGGAFISGTSTAFQGRYFVENRATVVKTIAAADGTNPRKDIVIARVRENLYDSSGFTAWDISVVTGTPAASPSAPATPANSMLLATVDVPAASTTVIDARITDNRVVSGRTELRLRRVANQAIGSATAAAISFDTEDADTLAVNSTGTTVTLGAGLWVVSFRMNASAGMSGGGTIYITHNSTDHVAFITNNNAQANVVALIDGTAASTLQALVYNNHSGSLNFTARLHAVRVSQ